MNNLLYYIFRFLLRIRWWVLFGSLFSVILAIYLTRDLSKQYEVNATIYTGLVSGVDIENVGISRAVDYGVVNNSMDNLINILTSKETLKKVSLRLLAQHLMYGSPNEDNEFIQAANFRNIFSHVPQDVKDLVDKSSEERTLENIINYDKSSTDNYVYGLFNWSHPIYSYDALSKLQVKRVGSSDMLELKYSYSDPGVAYNTLLIIIDEFTHQYKNIKYGEVDDVIGYFERELAVAKANLTQSEDSLTKYNMDYKVINYDEETKQVASTNFEFEQAYEDLLLRYHSSKREIEVLDKQMGEYSNSLKKNNVFLSKLDRITSLAEKKAKLASGDTNGVSVKDSTYLNKQLDDASDDFLSVTRDIATQKYSKEGIPSTTFLDQWLAATIDFAKAEAELKVMDDRKKYIDDKYTYFSPIGTTIKRKEREIGFNESSYLSILQGLNAAKLRRKNIQLSSASLKVINAPIFPVASIPTKRKTIILLVFVCSIIFILSFFVIVEILDRTLKDKFRTEMMTKQKVLAAIPIPSKFKYRTTNRECLDISLKYLSNKLIDYVNVKDRKEIGVINFISNTELIDRTFISDLIEVMEAKGLTVSVLYPNTDYVVESKEYLLARDVTSLTRDYEHYDLIFAVHPPLSQSSIPEGLVSSSCANILIVRANYVWRETDQILLNLLNQKSGDVPVLICLAEAQREAVEIFTGMLPPYTYFRKLAYKLLHLGLTAK